MLEGCYTCSESQDTPSSFMMVQTRTLRGRETIIIFIRMLQWLLFLTGVRHQQLLRNAHPTRKRLKRCANRLVGPYSHVLTVCRTINTHPVKLLRIAVINLMNLSLQKEGN